MIQTAFVDKNTGAIRASLTGTAKPELAAHFNTVLQLRVKFFSQEVLSPLADGTPLTLVAKKKGDFDGPAIALDTVADVEGSGDNKSYLLKAAVTGSDLHTALAGKPFDLFDLQFFWGNPNTEAAGGSEILPLTVVNVLLRDGDEIPSPVDSAGWAWLKAHIPAVEGVMSYDESAKTIVFVAAGDDEEGGAGREVELHAGETHLQWRYAGDAEWTDLIAIADLMGAPGTNGASAELQVGGGYIQWRPVGGSEWTNLIAVADLMGTPGTNGAGVELQVGGGYIQWRPVGGAEWTNLILVADLKGDPGNDAPGGGASITDPEVAYVQTDGDDTDGTGSPGAPFASPQKAIDRGFTVLRIGVGTFAGFVTSTDVVLRGCGAGKTMVGDITLNGNITIDGTHSLTIANIIASGANSVDNNVPGGDAPATVLHRCIISATVTQAGGNGWDGPTDQQGGAAGGAGSLTVHDCDIGSIILTGGAGGRGGNGTDAPPGSDGNGGNGAVGGTGGAGGVVVANNSRLGYVSASPGTPGAGGGGGAYDGGGVGGNSGDSGSGGSTGTIELNLCVVASVGSGSVSSYGSKVAGTFA